jgi:hypothetical protein
MINKKWIFNCNLSLTLHENLKMFFNCISDEIKNEYIYSEVLLIVDERTKKVLYPYIECSKLGFYNGIMLYIC